MKAANRWLLPEGVEDIPARQAWWIEERRSALLGCFREAGYDLVMPPMIEYLDSLLTGTGQDLALQTFTVTDQLTGRQMGIRADMTPQVARLDAHVLRSDEPARLCYAGPVLRTRARTVGGSREPIQFGAELFGEPGPASDGEIVQLMIESARLCELDAAPSFLQLDLGHVGVFRSLVQAALPDNGDNGMLEERLFDAVARRSSTDVMGVAKECGVDARHARMLSMLPELNGDRAVIDEARHICASESAVVEAIDNLEAVATLCESGSAVRMHFDLAELRGYNYHTGVVFALYVPGHGQAVAQGGRYDDIGSSFGRPRPATGFSADLLEIMRIRRARGAFQE